VPHQKMGAHPPQVHVYASLIVLFMPGLCVTMLAQAFQVAFIQDLWSFHGTAAALIAPMQLGMLRCLQVLLVAAWCRFGSSCTVQVLLMGCSVLLVMQPSKLRMYSNYLALIWSRANADC
jgi:hypothetical protein